jgi:hypothetical protein
VNDHPRRCTCIDCKAARDFYGPAVITPPSILDRGEHKLEAWQLRAPRTTASTDAKRQPKAAAAPIVRDRHPFGRKPTRSAKATGGRVDPATVTGKPWAYGVRPGTYERPPNTSYLYDNRWAS